MRSYFFRNQINDTIDWDQEPLYIFSSFTIACALL